MIDPLNDAVLKTSSAIESELIVRDFLDVIGCRDAFQLIPFLDSNVVYQPSSGRVVRGRAEVLRTVAGVADHFEIFAIRPLHVAVTGRMVLVEQSLRLGFVDKPIVELLSFASFEIKAYQIVCWRQLHG